VKRVLPALVLAPLLAAAAAAVSPGEALANGRFPEANKVFFAPNDPDTIMVRVTFGLVVSRDRGKSWDWVCEQSIGFTGVEDPMYAIGPSGTLFGTTFLGLTKSTDRLCTFGFEKGILNGKLFVDLSQRPNDPKSIVFFSSVYEGQNDAGQVTFSSNLFETTDEGATYTAISDAFDPTLLGETVDVAPSDAERLYLSGVRGQGAAPVGVLLTSRDHGKTWSTLEIPLLPDERSVFIAAVDPKNADRLYLRTSAADDMPTRILVSDDGGKTVRAVFTGKGALRGFALSPDGTRVWVGGPLDELHAASTTDFQFVPKNAKVYAPPADAGSQRIQIQCLTATNEGLWACSNERSGFIAGFSADDGATFTPRVRFCDIRGPIACPEGTTSHTQCVLGGDTEPRRAPWPIQRSSLGCGGSVGDGGSETGDAGVVPLPDEPTDDGCSCRTANRPSWAFLAGVVSVLAVMLRRTRRRPPRLE
jgi:hypothetical protein